MKWIRFLTLICTCPMLCIVAHAQRQDCSQWRNLSKATVVSISVVRTQNGGAVFRGNGTGFIVSPQGHVLTAYHVVASDAETDKVEAKGTIGSLGAPPVDLKIIDDDPRKDIALLQFEDSTRNYDVMPLGDPFKAMEDTPLCSFSFSAPLGVDLHSNGGSLSSKKGEDRAAKIKTLWTTDMPSNEGESGAPVIDLDNGGVVAMKYGGKDPARVQNVNFLIPLNLAKIMLETHCNVKIPSNTANNPTVGPVLLSVTATFTTAGDSKEADTVVSISVAAGGLLMAGGSGIAAGVEFGDSGNYGPFVLETPNTRITKTLYRASTVTLKISPQDERKETITDRWITQVQLEARFSDNEVLRTNSRPLTLDNVTRVVAIMNQ